MPQLARSLQMEPIPLPELRPSPRRHRRHQRGQQTFCNGRISHAGSCDRDGRPTTRIPSNAISSGDLNASTKWLWNHDPGTLGSSQGSSVHPAIGVSSDDAAREFYMTYSGHGGEIYHLSFATDKNATHFVYDTNVYVVDPSQLANLEMDMNDVMADGRTVILGTQCSTYSKSWEYTYQSGGHPHWRASNIPCDPKKWAANTWHHIQIASHRDGNGIATYDWVNVDETNTDFQNASGDSAPSLGLLIRELSPVKFGWNHLAAAVDQVIDAHMRMPDQSEITLFEQLGPSRALFRRPLAKPHTRRRKIDRRD
jgi:hypothetical protein